MWILNGLKGLGSLQSKTDRFWTVIIFVTIIIIFIRVIGIIKEDKEKGTISYSEIISLEIPVIETEFNDNSELQKNKTEILNILTKATGISNLSGLTIMKKEVSYFDNADVDINKLQLDPFKINDSSVSKTDSSYDKSLKKNLDTSKPEVLIYHTHTTESYAEDGPDSSNEQFNVVGVGDVLADELQNKYGISVIHDKTNHCISYINCYQRSNETVSKYLEKYGDFKLIIDLHRDSVEDKSATTTTIDNQKLVKVMFVNSKNSVRYSKNKKLTEEYFNKTNELFSGLTRGIYTYNNGKNAFNQGLSDNCILMEFGSNVNSCEEAKNTARYMARVIAEEINGKQ